MFNYIESSYPKSIALKQEPRSYVKRYVTWHDNAMYIVYNTTEEPSNTSANIVFEEGQVIKANPLVRPLQGQLLKTLYLKIHIKANPSNKPIDIYLDTSSSTNLVDKD